MRNALNRILGALLAGVAIAVVLAAPGQATQALAAENSEAAKAAIAKLSGKTAAVMTGTPQDEVVKRGVPDIELLYFNSMTDNLLALQSNKVDCFTIMDASYAFMVEEYPGLAYIDYPLGTYDVGTIFPKNDSGEKLREQYNVYIKQITDSGELQQLKDYWMVPRDWEDIDIPESGENGTLTMATSNTLMPFSMEHNGKNAGFDIAIAAGFCRANGYGLKIENVDFSGALGGIASGVYDLAAGQISYTEERAKSVLYSDFYFTQNMVLAVRASDFDASEVVTMASLGGSANSSGQSTGGDSSAAASQDGENPVWTGIRRTLFEQDRWKSILAGLATTLLITVAGFALANILGALLCAMAMSKSRVARGFARVYSALAQGLPIVVVLMVLYYIVFAGAKLNNVLVASIGFGLVFAAYMEQLFEGGIRGIEAGQWEAGLASGLTPRQTFVGIILPQAARTSITGFFSNLISLMKGTAIVGYIAVADLTKAGDVIRSTTYDAYIPLLTVSVIYLVLTGLLIALMELVKHLVTRPRRQKAGEAA